MYMYRWNILILVQASHSISELHHGIHSHQLIFSCVSLLNHGWQHYQLIFAHYELMMINQQIHQIQWLTPNDYLWRFTKGMCDHELTWVIITILLHTSIPLYTNGITIINIITYHDIAYWVIILYRYTIIIQYYSDFELSMERLHSGQLTWKLKIHHL